MTTQPTIVTDRLTVNIGLQQQYIDKVQVYDLSGKAIMNFRGRSGYNQINVSNFSRGSYIIRLQTPDGMTYSQRFVKQ
ncbi:MAG: T9SS type A sorting domain-containing protein [Bacteroidota bacterium]